MILDVESSILLHLHVNPFELGALPILDFMVYNKLIVNKIDEMGDDV
jgi:hypothetical protein